MVTTGSAPLFAVSGVLIFSPGTCSCSSGDGAIAAILFWDRGGLVLYYKRLERGRFRMPRVTSDGRSVEMDATELLMLLDGIDVRYVRHAEHWKPAQKETA